MYKYHLKEASGLLGLSSVKSIFSRLLGIYVNNEIIYSYPFGKLEGDIEGEYLVRDKPLSEYIEREKNYYQSRTIQLHQVVKE